MHAHISIGIDPEDIEQMSDFLQSIVVNNNNIHSEQTSSGMISRQQLKRFSHAILQMIGLFVTLVASNVITEKLTYHRQPVQQPNAEIYFRKNISFVDDEQRCNKEFGCNKNACWRSCYSVEDDGKKLFCYTSPNPKLREFHHCDYMNECSPSWECLEPCHN